MRNAQAVDGGVITMHHDGFGEDNHLAVCVKFYGFLESGEADQWMREKAFEYTQQEWWYEANNRAHEAGFTGLFALGRSAGWAVPFYQMRQGKLLACQVDNYPGTGPSLGYPTYPDKEDVEDVVRVLWLQDRIKEMMEVSYIQELFDGNLNNIIEDYNQEAMVSNQAREVRLTGFPIVDGNNYPMYYL